MILAVLPFKLSLARVRLDSRCRGAKKRVGEFSQVFCGTPGRDESIPRLEMFLGEQWETEERNVHTSETGIELSRGIDSRRLRDRSELLTFRRHPVTQHRDCRTPFRLRSIPSSFNFADQRSQRVANRPDTGLNNFSWVKEKFAVQRCPAATLPLVQTIQVVAGSLKISELSIASRVNANDEPQLVTAIVSLEISKLPLFNLACSTTG